MTIEQTRQLGIEFERRVQTMIPETELLAKLDTDTIYSFLNLYQDKFVHDLYKALDLIPNPSKPSAYVETLLSGLIKTCNISVTDQINSGMATLYSYDIPEDFGLYLDSYTKVSNTYEYKKVDNTSHQGLLHTNLVSVSNISQYFNKPQDPMRIIREPIGCINRLGDGTRVINVIYDRYTTPTEFDLTYYRVPQYMNLMSSSPCELPMDAFDDLVTGAVDLYVQYVAGAEARKRQTSQQRNKSNKEDEQ